MCFVWKFSPITHVTTLVSSRTSTQAHLCTRILGQVSVARCAPTWVMPVPQHAQTENMWKKNNNNNTTMIIPTFSPLTPSIKSPRLFHCFVNMLSKRPCQHRRDRGEGFPFVLPISMKELVRRQSDCITPGKGQNILIHTFNWFCSSGWWWSCYSWPFKYFLWRNVNGRGKNSGCNIWLVLVYSHRLDYSSFS